MPEREVLDVDFFAVGLPGKTVLACQIVLEDDRRRAYIADKARDLIWRLWSDVGQPGLTTWQGWQQSAVLDLRQAALADAIFDAEPFIGRALERSRAFQATGAVESYDRVLATIGAVHPYELSARAARLLAPNRAHQLFLRPVPEAQRPAPGVVGVPSSDNLPDGDDLPPRGSRRAAQRVGPRRPARREAHDAAERAHRRAGAAAAVPVGHGAAGIPRRLGGASPRRPGDGEGRRGAPAQEASDQDGGPEGRRSGIHRRLRAHRSAPAVERALFAGGSPEDRRRDRLARPAGARAGDRHAGGPSLARRAANRGGGPDAGGALRPPSVRAPGPGPGSAGARSVAGAAVAPVPLQSAQRLSRHRRRHRRQRRRLAGVGLVRELARSGRHGTPDGASRRPARHQGHPRAGADHTPPGREPGRGRLRLPSRVPDERPRAGGATNAGGSSGRLPVDADPRAGGRGVFGGRLGLGAAGRRRAPDRGDVGRHAPAARGAARAACPAGRARRGQDRKRRCQPGPLGARDRGRARLPDRSQGHQPDSGRVLPRHPAGSAVDGCGRAART